MFWLNKQCSLLCSCLFIWGNPTRFAFAQTSEHRTGNRLGIEEQDFWFGMTTDIALIVFIEKLMTGVWFTYHYIYFGTLIISLYVPIQGESRDLSLNANRSSHQLCTFISLCSIFPFWLILYLRPPPLSSRDQMIRYVML